MVNHFSHELPSAAIILHTIFDVELNPTVVISAAAFTVLTLVALAIRWRRTAKDNKDPSSRQRRSRVRWQWVERFS